MRDNGTSVSEAKDSVALSEDGSVARKWTAVISVKSIAALHIGHGEWVVRSSHRSRETSSEADAMAFISA